MLSRVISILKRCLHDRRLWAYFIIALLFFSVFMKLDFVTDTYADISYDPARIIFNFLRSGRPFTAFIAYVFKILGFGIRVANFLSFLLAIFSLTTALYLLGELIRKHLIANQVWSFILPLLIILNSFIIEFFMYVEKGIMLAGVLCCIIALHFYVTFLIDHKKRPLLYAFVFSILAAFCYQGTLGIFIILATLFTIKQTKTFKIFIKNTAISVAIYAVGAMASFILIKCITPTGRIGGEIILSASLKKIFNSLRGLFTTFDILPNWLLPVTIIAIIVIWLGTLTYHRQLFTNKTLQTFAMLIYLTVVIILAAVAPQITQSTDLIWIVPRTAYAFASLPGILLAIILSSSTSSTHFLRLPQVTNYALLFISLSLLIVQFYRLNTISINHYELTAIDQYRSVQIASLIAEYEAEHQTEVTTIMPAADAGISYSYSGIFQIGDGNISSYATEWSDINSLNYWTKRSFERQNPTEDWKNYCQSHDWSAFNNDQIRFSGSTLQICLY